MLRHFGASKGEGVACSSYDALHSLDKLEGASMIFHPLDHRRHKILSAERTVAVAAQDRLMGGPPGIQQQLESKQAFDLALRNAQQKSLANHDLVSQQQYLQAQLEKQQQLITQLQNQLDVQQKYHDYNLGSILHSQDQRPDAHLLSVGGGPRVPDDTSLSTGNVLFKSFQSQHDTEAPSTTKKGKREQTVHGELTASDFRHPAVSHTNKHSM